MAGSQGQMRPPVKDGQDPEMPPSVSTLDVSPTGGTDQGDNPASESELRDVDAVGFAAAISAGAQTVMASLSSWQGVRMHGSLPAPASCRF